MFQVEIFIRMNTPTLSTIACHIRKKKGRFKPCIQRLCLKDCEVFLYIMNRHENSSVLRFLLPSWNSDVTLLMACHFKLQPLLPRLIDPPHHHTPCSRWPKQGTYGNTLPALKEKKKSSSALPGCFTKG